MLFLEAILVIALALSFIYGGKLLSSINGNSKSSWNLPTLTPTPLIRPMILPGGRNSSIIETTVESGYDIPVHLRPLMNTSVSLPVPTPYPQQATRIQIPKLGIDTPVVQGDEAEQLKKGVGQHLGTADPGTIGNMVLSGHNDTYGEVFRYLDQLEEGDLVIVYTSGRSYTYVVDKWILVTPDRVKVMDPTPYASLTLISCYPYLIDTQRIIVTARLVD
jgi:sortase A